MDLKSSAFSGVMFGRGVFVVEEVEAGGAIAILEVGACLPAEVALSIEVFNSVEGGLKDKVAS